jgi:hypothetical protein
MLTENFEPLVELAKHQKDLLATIGLLSANGDDQYNSYVVPALVEFHGETIVLLSGPGIRITVLDVETLCDEDPSLFNMNPVTREIDWSPPSKLEANWRRVVGLIPFPFFCEFDAHVLFEPSECLRH